jgi:hypothetical protein
LEILRRPKTKEKQTEVLRESAPIQMNVEKDKENVEWLNADCEAQYESRTHLPTVP